MRAIPFDALDNLHPSCRINGVAVSDFYHHPSRIAAFEVINFLTDWFSKSDFITVCTSGSTGSPKKKKIAKKIMIASAIATAKYFGLSAKMSALLCLSADYIAGKMMIVRAMVLGLDLTVVPPNSTPLNHSSPHYDFAAMVPLQLVNSLSQIYKIKIIIVGGTPLPRLHLNTNTHIYETYGMTETVSHIALRQIHPKREHFFRVMSGISISVDDKKRLKIKSDRLGNKVIITNDLVEIKRGNTFRWLGRCDNIINSGGVKIIPEVEEEAINCLVKMPFILVGLPDDKLGQRLTLVVETQSKIEDKILLKKLKQLKTHPYKCPKSIVVLKKFVRTANGKINRKKTLDIILKTDTIS